MNDSHVYCGSWWFFFFEIIVIWQQSKVWRCLRSLIHQDQCLFIIFQIAKHGGIVISWKLLGRSDHRMNFENRKVILFLDNAKCHLESLQNSLRRYDTIKTCQWNFFKFSRVVHYRKICKNQFKNRGLPCYFLSSRGQKIKNITKIEQKRQFLFTFLVSFFMEFLVQKLIYTINIWFKFVFDSFF